MSNKVNKIVSKKAKEFNKLRNKLVIEGTRYILLQNDSRTGNFKNPFEILNGIHSYNSYHTRINVRVASNDQDFIDALYKASDIAVGVSTALVYAIIHRDIGPPDAERPWWDIYCDIPDDIMKYEVIT